MTVAVVFHLHNQTDEAEDGVCKGPRPQTKPNNVTEVNCLHLYL